MRPKVSRGNVFHIEQSSVRVRVYVWVEGFMTDSDAPRLRELTKMMASENDPVRLRVLAEELKTIVAKQGSEKPTENSAM
jgi:hypothetical protein